MRTGAERGHPWYPPGPKPASVGPHLERTAERVGASWGA